MKVSYFSLVLAVLLVAPALITAQEVFPRMTSVEPAMAKGGEVVTAAGENLDKATVAEVYLTDGKTDVKVEITEQAATAIKVKIPDAVKPGRFSLMVMTATKPPRLIEQPVRVTVQ